MISREQAHANLDQDMDNFERSKAYTLKALSKKDQKFLLSAIRGGKARQDQWADRIHELTETILTKLG